MLMYKWNRTYRVREGQVGFFVRVKALFTEHFIDTLHCVHQEICRICVIYNSHYLYITIHIVETTYIQYHYIPYIYYYTILLYMNIHSVHILYYTCSSAGVLETYNRRLHTHSYKRVRIMRDRIYNAYAYTHMYMIYHRYTQRIRWYISIT